MFAAAQRTALRAAPVVALVAFLVWFGVAQTDATGRYWVQLGIEAMVAGTAVVGVNLLLGYTGLLSLGHFAFFVYGGFVGAIWTAESWRLDPWLGFPIAFATGMLLGALLALTCAHLRGFYLTVVTLAFGLLASSIALVFDRAFGGLSGRAVAEPLDTNFAFVSETSPNRPYVGLYWLGVALFLGCLYVSWNIVRSRWGRAYQAIREAELAAATCGIPTYSYKVSAFALSAGMVSLAGLLAAQTALQVTMPDGTTTTAQSFRHVIDVVFGGAGTLAGPVVGAFTFTLGLGLEFGGRSLNDRLGAWQTAFLALVVMGVTILAPRGVVGSLQRRLAPVRRRLQPIETDGPVMLPRPRHRVAPGEPLLDVHDVSRTFGGIAALSGVDLVVRAGTIHALIGPNGSGKSTLINVVTGVVRPNSGRVAVAGNDFTGARPHDCSRRARIGRTFQNCRIFRRMTVLENVMVGAHSRTPGGLLVTCLLPVGLRPWERHARAEALDALRFVGLASRAHDDAAALPFTDQRRLEIARALAGRPDVVLLDEPAAGMHPREIRELVQLVRAVRDAGTTVLLVEHHMEVVRELADRVTVLNFGRVIAEGATDEVARDPQVVAAYLGEQAREAREARAARPRVSAVESGQETEPAPLLSVRDLQVRYGAATALAGVSLDVCHGEVIALVGANGAGKTTTLKSISGVSELLKATRGVIVFDGHRIDRLPAHAITRLGVTHVPEGRHVFAESTVEENLELGAFRRRDHAVRADIDAVYDRFPILGNRRRQLAGQLSGGEQQMLAIGRALVARPRLLLLDEPSLGLSPIIADEVFEVIRGLADERVTILLVEQLAKRVLDLADRVYILETGTVVRHAAAADLARDSELQAAYFGE